MSREWEPITNGRLIAFFMGCLVLVALIFRSEAGFVFLLDHANLLFHEAGHPIVGLFSSRWEPYGGTVGQLVFPVVLVVSFWRKRNAVGVAAGAIWFCENLFNIARYVADARAMVLPLVGGGNHDWNTILNRWNIPQYDIRIANVLTITGWCGIGGVTAWIVYRAWQDRHREVDFESKEFQVW